MEKRIINTEFTREDAGVENHLRPRTLDEYVGQEKAKDMLRVYIEAAKSRGEALDHVLFYGPPGLGKTTLAGILACEMGSELRITAGPAIEKPGEMAAILNSLQIGFRTLAIQKHSSEVWTILGAVKKEFEKIGGMLEKAQKNLQSASGQIEEVLGTRTRVIQRKLKEVDTLNDREARAILPEIGPLEKEETEL